MSRPSIRPSARLLPPRLSQTRDVQHSVTVKAVSTRRASSTTHAPSSLDKQTLSWEDYLRIRGRKRRWELASTIPITSAAAIGGISYFGVNSPQFMGLDPLLTTALATIGVAGLGYLIGPVVGSQLWRLTHRNTMTLIEDKDRQFHQHIKRNRVDPSLQSANNPVPDFYGEKIGSINQYRQWLRDQARYRRKAAWGKL